LLTPTGFIFSQPMLIVPTLRVVTQPLTLRVSQYQMINERRHTTNVNHVDTSNSTAMA
jgi:hypothetical protein